MKLVVKLPAVKGQLCREPLSLAQLGPEEQVPSVVEQVGFLVFALSWSLVGENWFKHSYVI